MSKIDIKPVMISKVTGKLANNNTPEEFRVSTFGYNIDIPGDTVYTPISVDSSCGGKISPLTPPEQRQRASVFSPTSITSFDIQDIINRYAGQNKFMSDPASSIYARLLTKEPIDYCE
jgi:hypothetical protein